MANTNQTGPQQSENSEFFNTNLQESIMAATASGKTLLCFVADDSATSSQWQTIIADRKYRPRLTAEAVTLKITAGSQEAQYLHGVCPLNGIPSIVMVKRGAIEQNLQHPHTSETNLCAILDSLFGQPADAQEGNIPIRNIADVSANAIPTNSTASTDAYIVLPPSAGRMRLPNNAYDAFRNQTEKWSEQNIRGDNILKLQLRLLAKVPNMAEAITSIETREHDIPPQLSTTHQDRLLNTPANALGLDRSPAPTSTTQSASSTSPSVRDVPGTRPGLSANNSNATSQRPDSRSRPSGYPSAAALGEIASASQGSANSPAPTQRATPTSNSRPSTVPSNPQAHNEQIADYTRLQRERQAAERAERERIKAQIASDRAERRRAEDVRRESERRNQLEALRTANSTTAKPSSSDIRIQVRTYDGTTIKTTFTRDAKISTDVRDWVDNTSKNIIPYNLKWIRTPEPNRNIEAGEEEQTLSDLGIIGSATLVMVPVKGYVESYAGSGSGLVGAVTGAVGGVLGGLGSLIGWGGSAPAEEETRNEEVANPPVPESRPATEQKMRIRTLADQRAEEAKKRGNELYNGNQLNFQGRGDDDKKED